ncbi:hypothetical protein LCGC14_0515040 [marine sediment metagenome]|uniref:Uncharacterized protein n=1 Tax=marine sediment metagenome TaxID=412755 RepID=A0A0F9V8D5_9ZZZZ
MSLFGSKKAQAENYIAVAIFLLIFGFISVLATFMWLEFIDAFTAAGYYEGQMEETGNKFLATLKLYDTIIVLIMIVLLIGVGLTSYKLRTSPAFFIITLITAAITGFVSFFFNFIFIELVNDDLFAATLVFFPKTMLINTNLHWITLAAIIIGSITLYAKRDSGELVQQ